MKVKTRMGSTALCLSMATLGCASWVVAGVSAASAHSGAVAQYGALSSGSTGTSGASGTSGTSPSGAPTTGGGGTAGTQDAGLFGIGGAALLIGAGGIAYRRKKANAGR